MRLLPDRPIHLTYCTNIHPADGWTAVSDTLARYAPALKRRLSPDAPFGLGLRLSARDVRELRAGSHLTDFREWLDREGLYVAIINGFPYGAFHGTPVKADVYAPDWRDDARVAYTLDLIHVLSALVPAGMDGGVSTAPLSYKPWMGSATDDDWRRIAVNVARVGEALVRLRQQSGAMIHLDIEPEPDCSIENTDDTLSFFERWLLPCGVPHLSEALGLSHEAARQALLDHIRVCFDCCHFAVEYEDPLAAIDRLTSAGIQIGRVQLSSAIRVNLPADPAGRDLAIDRLRPFADSVYLHQVIEQGGPSLAHFPDLDAAFAAAPHQNGGEWRVHFHVPLFTGEYNGLQSTQDYVRTVLDRAVARPFTTHLEIETYTWDVLPANLKLDLLDSIGREYDWVLSAVR